MKTRTRLKTLMTIIAALGLAAPAYAENLSTDEIVKLLKGTTIQTGDMRGRNIRITLKPDGTLEGERKGRNTAWDEGKWWTEKNGLFCFEMDFLWNARKRCNFLSLQKDGKTLKRLKTNGALRKNDWVIK